MYGALYFRLFTDVWQKENQSHGMLVYLIVLFLFYQNRQIFLQTPSRKKFGLIAWSLLIAGCIVFVLGRTQSILPFEMGSQILIILALILGIKGSKVARAFWFPLFFLVFSIPFPEYILDAITLPMKIGVSTVCDFVLFHLGFPIGRDGVILQIAGYQLLVADACAGMKTLMSLEALGLLYLNLVKHDSFVRNLTLAILIIPISFFANVVRVSSLVLITYFFGDAAGRGFMHNFAGMVLFVIALILILSIDNMIQKRVELQA